ncbi:MAG: hypothetical protein LBI72_07135 [Flavobacteriaceae bacterium]|jgi:hypothetical protein|nr:hypothetical protein [Flavobacteriaceae bacterium]
MKKVLVLIPVFAMMLSCNKQEMNLTRSAYSVIEEVTDHSPIYIEKDAESNKAKLNDANRVGGTNYIFNVERELNLKEVISMAQKIKNKKYAEDSMHKDDKQVLFSYADTLHKNLAFFPFQSITYQFDKPATKENLLYLNASKDLFYNDQPVQRDQLVELFADKQNVQLGFSFSLDFEPYLQLRILLTQLGLNDKLNKVELIY